MAFCSNCILNERWFGHELERETVQYTIVLIPLFKAIYYVLFLGSLMCCYSSSDSVFNLQRCLLMLLVAAETITRTTIGVFFFLISRVSLSTLV